VLEDLAALEGELKLNSPAYLTNSGLVQRRLGGMLNYYYRSAA
jgi:hypothetical protein